MEVYEGPQLRPPRVSLLSAAEIVPMDSERWYARFDLILEGCEDSRVRAVCPPLNASPQTYTAGGQSEEYQPYVLYATDKCSTFPSGREFYDRAQRKLLAGEAAALEEQLWTGLVGGVTIATNAHLADPTTTVITSTETSPQNALAVLDQRIGKCSAGQGMIHVRPQVMPQLLAARAVRREGNVYLTAMDTIVVPGRGYPGTGPTGQAVGATEWMYGHPGIVQIRRGPVIRVGEDTNSSVYDRLVNDHLVIVQRVVNVALDNTCCVFANDFNALQ